MEFIIKAASEGLDEPVCAHNLALALADRTRNLRISWRLRSKVRISMLTKMAILQVLIFLANNLKKSRLVGHDLPISLKDRVISPFREGCIFV